MPLAPSVGKLGFKNLRIERLRRGGATRRQPRADRLRQIVDLDREFLQDVQPALGVIKVDPSERRTDPDVARCHRFASLRCDDISARAFGARMALLRIGNILPHPHRLADVGVGKRRIAFGLGQPEIVEIKVQLGIGELIRRHRGAPGARGRRFASIDTGRICRGDIKRLPKR